jgi:16S rRNA (cytidine1402-2'-O)-methyltransferase
MTGTLFLIPTPLGDTPLERVLPEETRHIAARLEYFIVEHAKTARAFLKQVGTEKPIQSLQLSELSEHTPANQLEGLLAPLLAGHDVGLLSEAGCPAIADPGADFVRLAHRYCIQVKPLVGPSSILLALMASGLVGQRFTFHGYLPAKPDERAQTLRALEKRSANEDAAQIFIETPYRNRAMLDSLSHACRPDTWLTLARDLTTDSELIATKRLLDWRDTQLDLERKPCVFVLWAEAIGTNQPETSRYNLVKAKSQPRS